MKPLWLLGRILGTRCLSFGPRVAWLGEELVASLSEQRGLDAGKKQIVARMGFLEVPLRAGRGPGPRQVAAPSTQLQVTGLGGHCSTIYQGLTCSGVTGLSLPGLEEVEDCTGCRTTNLRSRSVRYGASSVPSLLVTWGCPFLALAAGLYLSDTWAISQGPSIAVARKL